jgi:hypothetical protein
LLAVLVAVWVAGTMAGFTDGANAQAVLGPVQYVNPSSTLQEIQNALNTGGTVLFEYGDYYQIASSTPDVPPTPATAKGFNIGRYGEDVNVIGLTGPNGERPRIHGGNVAFRVNIQPVNFKIENLEICNPDLSTSGLLNSRVGILVLNVLGSQSVINNCRITITGKSTDPGALGSHSAGIWFQLPSSGQFVTSGAQIEITDNEIIADNALAGIVLGHFRAETPIYAGPRVLIDRNTIQASHLRGYTLNNLRFGAAIILAGGWPDSAVTNNVIAGDGHFPNYEDLAIYYAASQDLPSPDITVAGNDSSGFMGGIQLYLNRMVSGARVANNAFGPADETGVMCYGSENRFVNNHFSGAYPGWDSAGEGAGLFWFADQPNASTSEGNTLVSAKLNGPPYGFDICNEVKSDAGDANKVPGYQKCSRKSDGFLQRMRDRKADIETRLGEYIFPLISLD